jgi:hypothetical protein
VVQTKQQLRRQRRNLKQTGDFLGVTGVNPYTGELDVITPPTSSSNNNSCDGERGDGIISQAPSPASSSSSSAIPHSSLLSALSQQAREAREMYDAALAKRKARLEREERKLKRAEQRKEVVREAVKEGGVKWMKEEGGWLSVTLPGLTQASGSVRLLSEAADSTHLTTERGAFLGMVAAVRVLGRRHYHRRSSTSSMEGEEVEMGMEALAQRLQQEGYWLGTQMGNTELSLAGDLGSTEVVTRFRVPTHHRLGPCRKINVGYPGDLLEWDWMITQELPTHPTPGLLEDMIAHGIWTGRVLELDGANSAKGCSGGLVQDQKTLDGVTKGDDMNRSHWPDTMTKAISQSRLSACIRTITTTGSECSQQDPSHAGGHNFDGTLDELEEALLMRRYPAPPARSQQTSSLSSTTTPSSDYSPESADFRHHTQPSAWLSPAAPAPSTEKRSTAAEDVTVMVLLRAAPTSEVEPELDSATTSSTRSQEDETTTPPEDSSRSAWRAQTEGEHGRKDRTRSQTEQESEGIWEWEMRKTMRRKKHPRNEAVSAKKLAPAYTSTYLAKPSCHYRQTFYRTAMARRAARAAFQVAHQWTSPPTPGPSMTTVQPPVSASRGNPGPSPGQAKPKTSPKQPVVFPLARNAIIAGHNGKGDTGSHSRPHDIMRRILESCTWAGAWMVGGYWRVVAPAFDGSSDIRKRLDKAQATWEDWGFLVLAVGFVFLAVSAGVWAIRGIVLVARLFGMLGGVLRIVAGF